MTLGEKIRDLRKKRKWSQNELAEKADSHAALVGKYERDEVSPSLEAIKKLSEAFAVSVDYLLKADARFDVLKKTETTERIEKIETLPEKEKQTVFTVIDALVRDYEARKTYSK